jgi:ATP synthase protein I
MPFWFCPNIGDRVGRFKETRDSMEHLALVSQVGLTMAGSIGLCFAIGYFLDKWLGTRGIFLVIFIILGVIGGGVTVYRQIMKVTEPGDQDEKNGNNDA